LLESYIDSLLYKKVSQNPKNYCTCRSLPKTAKTKKSIYLLYLDTLIPP
jgi:hypothetical protein